MTRSASKLKEKLIRDTTGSLGLRAASLILGILTSIILARLLGKEGFGIYTYAMTWPTLLGIPATLGFNNLLVREVAIYNSKSTWGLLRGLLQWSNFIVLIVSTMIALIGIALVLNFGNNGEREMTDALCMALISLPIVSLTSLRLAAMKGLHRVVLGQMPEKLLAPLLLLIFSIVSFFWLKGRENATIWILSLQMLAFVITFAIGAILLTRVMPQEIKKAAPEYKIVSWLKDGIPFILMGGLVVINSRVAVLMLGSLQGASAVGVYAVVSRITTPIIFALGILNNVLSPTFATLYAEGKLVQLQRLVTRSTRLITLSALAMTIGLIILRQWVLSLFGAEFVQGQTALIILSIGYLVNAMTGSVAVLLSMTRHANFSAATVGLGVTLNVLLNWILIPKWGVNGAAVATATSMIVGNVINVIWVRLKLGIKSTAI
jgi:O-antigen/teichoic acid export membrane protein